MQQSTSRKPQAASQKAVLGSQFPIARQRREAIRVSLPLVVRNWPLATDHWFFRPTTKSQRPRAASMRLVACGCFFPWKPGTGNCILVFIGEWLSLVEHLVRDQGVGGSNPLSPTIFFKQIRTFSDPPKTPTVDDFVDKQTSWICKQDFYLCGLAGFSQKVLSNIQNALITKAAVWASEETRAMAYSRLAGQARQA